MEQKTEQSGERKACVHCGLLPAGSSSRGEFQVVCESAPMRELFRRAARFAMTDAPVVVSGESGTGKEVIARTLHANSARAEGPFVAVNVAALPDDLLESELFGHARGAFTGALQVKEGLFEVAHQGTLLLDEIAELPLGLQAKLLRALQEGEIRRVGDTHARKVDVRIVCATHRQLAEQVRQGQFREDLFYRLQVLSLRVPPLRDRLDDILPLARHLLAQERGPAKAFSPRAEKVLLAYRWPGNVRELQNAVKYAAALSTEPSVPPELLPDELHSPAVRQVPKAGVPGPSQRLADVERAHIQAVLESCHGSQTEAARVLGIGRNTLWRKLRQEA